MSLQQTPWLVTHSLASIAALGLSGWLTYEHVAERTALRTELASTTAALGSLKTELTTRLDTTDSTAVSLADRVYRTELDLERTGKTIRKFDEQVGDLSGSVETLTKLTTTDPELLQKYSKIYFLNENYKPADLTVIDEAYDYKNGKEVTVETSMWPFLRDLLRAADGDGVHLSILSGYRSFAEQMALKSAYTVRYGSGANQFSADQGYSEHQLGTTVDVTTDALGENLAGFDGTEAYRWLEDHAYTYGFVLSYPKGNSYYTYEPWHWRFVGTDLARYLHRTDKHFYDLEQRDIDEYLATLFDR